LKKTCWLGSLQRTHHDLLGPVWVQFYRRIGIFQHLSFYLQLRGGLKKGFFT